MRQLTGLLILLYGLLLALNTGLPTVAKIAGDQVQATVHNAECTDRLGKPPFAGVYAMCVADWPGSDGGQLFGSSVAQEGIADAYSYPLLSNFAVLPPDNKDQVAAIISVIIIALGITMVVAGRHGRRKAQGGDPGEDAGEEDADGYGGREVASDP